MNISYNENIKNISLEYTDSHFNLYRLIINNNDPFVVNYMNNNIENLYNLLNENEYNIQVDIDNIILIYNKPLYLKYKLMMVNKSNNDEKLNLILKKLSLFENEIQDLKDRSTELESQLENGVVLPGYNGGIIDINETVLMLNYYNNSLKNGNTNSLKINNDNNYLLYNPREGGLYIQKYKMNNFNGRSLKPLKYLKNLKILFYTNNEFIYDTNIDSVKSFYEVDSSEFNNLSYLQSLEVIYLEKFNNIKDLNFLASLNNLKFIKIINCPNLSNIDSIKELPLLKELVLNNCPKVINTIGFGSQVTITKN